MSHRDVYIAAAVRTPIGGFGGTLAGLTAPELGSIAIKGALEKSRVPPGAVEEVVFGNVLSGNLGQNPARQASKGAGLPDSVICTTVNKVCASGMKALIIGAQSIALGSAEVVVVGGMESMSNTPYYLPKHRFGSKYGHQEVVDGIVKDGLFDVYNKYLMGNAAEETAKEQNVTRVDQDNFAIASYERAIEATKGGLVEGEIVPVVIPGARGKPATTVNTDEDIFKFNKDKMSALKSPFIDGGSVTAANASPLSDGAAALVLVSEAKARELGIVPLAKVRGWGEAEREPERFTLAPALAVPKALRAAGLDSSSIDYWEINEAFAVVSLANQRILGVPADRLNVFGGAVAMGHPLGCSGARIIVTLLNVLGKKGGKLGVAGVCNGGGGASAVVIEKLA